MNLKVARKRYCTKKILYSNKKPIIIPYSIHYISNLKRFYEHYANMLPRFNSFKQIFKQLTYDHGAIVIMNHDVHKNLCIFNRYLQNIDYRKLSEIIGTICINS